jgi:hypothetical protein
LQISHKTDVMMSLIAKTFELVSPASASLGDSCCLFRSAWLPPEPQSETGGARTPHL